MFAATRALRQAAGAAHAERTPMIKFIGKRSIPSSVDHTPHAHPASPSHTLPEGFSSASSTSSPSSTSFSSYRQQAQQHGPLGRKSSQSSGNSLGSHSGHSLGAVAPAKGEYFDRNELPARFRRTPYTQDEIDAIETGGATLPIFNVPCCYCGRARVDWLGKECWSHVHIIGTE